MTIFAGIKYLNPDIREKVEKEAEKKFGAKNSYVKNLWILKTYRKQGGKTKFEGKKPSGQKITKQIEGKFAEVAVPYIEDSEAADELLTFLALMDSSYIDDFLNDANYTVETASNDDKTLNKPFRLKDDDKKKFGVYVKNKQGNVVLVKFGDPNMEIKRDNPEKRAAFRARHNCDEKKDKTTPGYWSCKMWSNRTVNNLTK